MGQRLLGYALHATISTSIKLKEEISHFVLDTLMKNDLCHAHMHSLIHDGRLRACQSYLLGLMYGCKVNVCS
jgi:hypothetical protein